MLAPIRRALVKQVRSTFNDASKGERPVPASDEALFPPGSVIRRVHGDVTSMMVGGIAALLTQMLHPKALAGVWDHSDVDADMLGRLRRTARFIATTTYAHRDNALDAISKVKAIHEQVTGRLPDGSDYRASDPWLLAWVHVAGAVNFLEGWRRYGEPAMSPADQDRYFAESAEIARLLDADPVPRSRAEARRLIGVFRGELHADERTRRFRDLVLNARARTVAEAPVHLLVMKASVDLMPGFAREMHGLSRTIARPIVRGATFSLASTLRWAFAGERRG
ncbi:MAG TPA: oxygenase MpaB family protein [Sphingomicrobium sp.]|jgi:uncharacterized protein (DUF2236 family)|nr:oxygenase MpaB family protein [Sphingomicrobium sp.]